MRKLIIILILYASGICSVQSRNTYFFIVEQQNPHLFEQVDSIISVTDINRTLKPESRISLDDYKFFCIFESKEESKKAQGETPEYWFRVSGHTEPFNYGKIYCFYVKSRCYIALSWMPIFFKKVLDVVAMGVYTRTYPCYPQWDFKVKGGKIVQAIYHYEGRYGSKKVHYDLLKDMIISEGCSDMQYDE